MSYGTGFVWKKNHHVTHLFQLPLWLRGLFWIFFPKCQIMVGYLFSKLTNASLKMNCKKWNKKLPYMKKVNNETMNHFNTKNYSIQFFILNETKNCVHVFIFH